MAATEPHGRRSDAGIDTEYLRSHQYKDPTNLHARVALHAKHTVAEQPWFEWVANQIDWPPDGDVLEVGCGSGLLWANIAPLLAELHLTLTDISEGMLDAATAAVAPFANMDLVELARRKHRSCRSKTTASTSSSPTTCCTTYLIDLGLLTSWPGSFAPMEFSWPPRTVRGTSNRCRRHRERSSVGPRWTSLIAVSAGPAEVISSMSRSPTWNGAAYQSALVCDEPEDVYNFIASSSTAQQTTAQQMQLLREVIARMFDEGDGLFRSPTDTGCFLARRPLR